jgi:hypothetical protein
LSHDFDPSWDYPVVELDAVRGLSSEDKTRVRHAIDTLKTSLACALGFTAIEVFFVEPMGLTAAQDMNAGRSVVAVYAQSTIGRWLNDDMGRAVANGANSVSMPDELVEIAVWLHALDKHEGTALAATATDSDAESPVEEPLHERLRA